ncbi:chitin deacetylase [Salix suchowensis]|nr:chitin deacetylase [Salix suchowensis]
MHRESSRSKGNRSVSCPGRVLLRDSRLRLSRMGGADDTPVAPGENSATEGFSEVYRTLPYLAVIAHTLPRTVRLMASRQQPAVPVESGMPTTTTARSSGCQTREAPGRRCAQQCGGTRSVPLLCCAAMHDESPFCAVARSKTSPHMDLSPSNCPPAFVGFLRVWSNVVQPIQSLVPEQQHDLARIICGLEPISQQVNPSINGIAADLRAVAIEISQRRSFQNRYASDLQAALDSGAGQSDPRSRKASFVPLHHTKLLHHRLPLGGHTTEPHHYRNELPPSTPIRLYLSHLLAAFANLINIELPSSTSSTPSILTPDTPAIELIRETLYAALGDVLESHSSVRTLLKRDPPRAYFASVGFAILYTAENAITPMGKG